MPANEPQQALERLENDEFRTISVGREGGDRPPG